MSENPKLTLADLDQFLETPEKDLTPYLEAAAVLAEFDPFTILPAREVDPPADRGQILDYLIPRAEQIARDASRNMWSLLLADRRLALRQLKTRERMVAALAVNETIDTPAQRMLLRVLKTEPISLDSLSREELVGLSTVVGWLNDILDGLPDPNEIRKELARADLLAPMRRLAGSGFVGRAAELQQIENFVQGPLSPAPLFIYGTGGVGKSTLLARYILTRLVPLNAVVVYIDLDRPSIRPQRPYTLLLEVLNQMRQQLDIPAEAVDALTKDVSYELAGQEDPRVFESVASSEEQPIRETLDQLLANYLSGKTAVLIVDTMEEAQFLGPETMEVLIELLVRLHYSSPLRVILAGRALPKEFLFRALAQFAKQVIETGYLGEIPQPYRPMNLGDLDEVSARQLLAEALRVANIDPLTPAQTDEVIGVVSRNPMCLKLAARVLRDQGKLQANRSEFMARLRAEKIQALLYSRILLNVHGDEVRKVAYPGLIVRRITREVIRDVLAEPCKLQFTDSVTPDSIFRELEREAALVEVDPSDGSLRHRADVRRAMLPDLSDHLDPDVIASIDSKAIEFYQDQAGGAARAEEIYHRLRRREGEETLKSRWIPDAVPFLKNTGDELPAQQRLWLAGKLGVTLDDSVRKDAGQEAWEDQVATAVSRLLISRSPDKALTLFRERAERLPRSRLFNLETETYRILGLLEEALAVARAGVESCSKAGATDMVLELLSKMALIEEGRGMLKQAEDLLVEAQGVAAHSTNQLSQLSIRIASLRVGRKLHTGRDDDRARMRQETITLITPEVLQQLRKHPVQLRETAAELGRDDARIAAAALETLGLEVNRDEQAHALGSAIARLMKDQPSQSAELAKKGAEFEASQFDAATIRRWVRSAATSTHVRTLAAILSKSEKPEVLKAFEEYFRFGTQIGFSYYRPVSLVRGNSYDDFAEPWAYLNSPEIKARISRLFPSVGRIEVPNLPQIPYGGTGFVVGDGLVMTARHVAVLFAKGVGLNIAFTSGSAVVDFAHQIDSPPDDASQQFEVTGVAMVHPYWDMALLRISGLPSGRMLTLSTKSPEALRDSAVVAIGYPSRDWRWDTNLQDLLLGGVYNVKRLQPGLVLPPASIQSYEHVVKALTHDVFTMGGNTGSPVIEIETGEVVGLHFAWGDLKAGYAVPMYELARDRRVAPLLNFHGSVPPTNDWEPAWLATERKEQKRTGMAWKDLTPLEHRLTVALDQYDWEGAHGVCQEILQRLRDEPDEFPEANARRFLQKLRRKRRFTDMAAIAEGLMESGLRTPQVRRQYAQALIEQGMFTMAELMLQSNLDSPGISEGEKAESRGLLGRTFKQLYVNSGSKNTRAQRHLQRAYDEYSQAWQSNPTENTWHSINMVALLARAKADNVTLQGARDPDALATNILAAIDKKEAESTKESEAFDLATRMEALIALGRTEEVESIANVYADALDADAFEVASTLRQMQDVWKLNNTDPPGSILLPILRAALLRKEGGGIVVPLAEARHDLQKVFGSDKSRSLKWYLDGLERAKSVCRVETADGKGFGTGWMVKSTDFFSGPTRMLVLTNAHVVSTTWGTSIRPPDAWLNFQMLGKRVQMKSIVWSSPVPELDATFVDLAEDVTGAGIPIYSAPMEMADPGPRMYIIGHPGGRDLEFSLNDNRLIACNSEKLHYRTPTEGGSSGSPIFDAVGWQAVGLHHAGQAKMPKLNGPAGETYAANEGIAILAIQQRTRSGS